MKVPIAALAGAAAILGLFGAALGEATAFLGIGLIVALVGGVVLIAQPFIGVVLIALISQVDALLSLVLQSLPGVKLLAVATLGAALINLAYRQPRSRIDPNPAIGCAIVFTLFVIASTLFASEIVPALTGMRRFLSMVLLFVLVVILVDTERKVGIVLAATIGACVLSALIMIADTKLGLNLIGASAAREASGDARPTDATTAASVLLAGASSALVLALRGDGLIRIAAGAAMLIIVTGIVISATRSAAMGFGVALAWQAWMRRRNPFVVTTAIFGGVAMVSMLPDALLERLALLTGSGYDFTIDRRIGYHLIGFDLITKNPFLGIGPDNFADYYTKFEYRWIPGRTLTPRVLHNMYLAVAVETGVGAAIAFTGILAFSLHGCWKAGRDTASPRLALYGEAILFGAIMLFLVSATLPNETNKYVWIYAGLAAAVARIEHRRHATGSRGGGALSDFATRKTETLTEPRIGARRKADDAC